MKKKIRVYLTEAKQEFIERVPRIFPIGNFQLVLVTYNYKEYIVNTGDEYLRDEEPVYILGKVVK